MVNYKKKTQLNSPHWPTNMLETLERRIEYIGVILSDEHILINGLRG